MALATAIRLVVVVVVVATHRRLVLPHLVLVAIHPGGILYLLYLYLYLYRCSRCVVHPWSC